jgi:hypothetical protein
MSGHFPVLRAFLVRPLYAMCAFMALCSAGCVIFEKETAVLLLSPDQDKAHALLVYKGLHTDADKKQLNDDLQIVTAMFKDRQAFYVGHPLFLLFLQPPETLAGKFGEKEKVFQALLRQHLKIAHATLFMNKEGKLCGSQIIEVRQLGKFVEAINALISAEFTQLAKEKLGDEKNRGKDWDVQSLRMVQKAASESFPWIRIESGRVNFTLLGSPTFFAARKREVLDSLITEPLTHLLPAPSKAPKPAVVSREQLQEKLDEMKLAVAFLTETPLSVDHRHDRLSLSVGLGNGEPVRLNIDYGYDKNWKKSGKSDNDIVAHARTLTDRLDRDVTTETLVTNFLREYAVGKQP